jgi:tetratricopeptide (TPR) repeat protein
MDCREVEDEGVAESYVAGRLDAAARDAFEAHYFECDECLARLEACRLLGRSLAERQANSARRVPGPPAAWWSLGLAAAAALVAVVSWPHGWSPASRREPPSAVSPARPTPAPLAELGRFEPPAAAAVVWRDGGLDAPPELQAGMRLYRAGDYSGSIALLRRAAASAPDSVESHFFLGISLLLTQDVEGGITSLERARALGDTPYLEPALFYLAKAELTRGRRAEAEGRLRQVVALRGDREAAARELLRRLGARPPE